MEGRTAKRQRTAGGAGAASDDRDVTMRVALALHEEHGIVFDEVIATFNALGRDSRGRTTLDEIDALAEGRRFCATMNASVSLRRIFSRLGDFVPRGDTVKKADNKDNDDAVPAPKDKRRASYSCSTEGSLVPTSSDDSDSDRSCEPSPACFARALADEPAAAVIAPSGRDHSGSRVSFIVFCHSVLAAARNMKVVPRSSLDTLRGSLDAVPAADDDDARCATW